MNTDARPSVAILYPGNRAAIVRRAIAPIPRKSGS